jgi:excisionase family DNA binding protein
MQEDTIQPINVTVAEAVRISGVSQSELYRRLARNEVHALKLGRSTLINMESLRAFIAKLPAASFRAPQQAAA